MNVLLALLLAASATSAPAPRTFRVDYFHTGNATEERFSLDRLVVEPLPWPGNPSRGVDETNLGKYLFEVRDRDTNRLVYSRGFASIYGEWETTPEAREMNRTFHESLRFPTPEKPVQVILKKRAKDNSLPRGVELHGGPQGHVRGPVRARLARPAAEAARERPVRGQGGLPHPRGWLHREGARQVREGRAAAGGHPLQLLALQGAQGRTSTSGG